MSAPTHFNTQPPSGSTSPRGIPIMLWKEFINDVFKETMSPMLHQKPLASKVEGLWRALTLAEFKTAWEKTDWERPQTCYIFKKVTSEGASEGLVQRNALSTFMAARSQYIGNPEALMSFEFNTYWTYFVNNGEEELAEKQLDPTLKFNSLDGSYEAYTSDETNVRDVVPVSKVFELFLLDGAFPPVSDED